MSWEWRMVQNLKRTWLVNSKLIWGIWRILTRALENLKNLNFNELLLTKVYNVWANKKVQRSYVWLHWRLMQIFTRARSKVQKLGLLLGEFLCFFTTFDLIWPTFCPKDHTQLTFFCLISNEISLGIQLILITYVAIH